MNRTLTTLSLLGLCIASASAAQAQSVPLAGTGVSTATQNYAAMPPLARDPKGTIAPQNGTAENLQREGGGRGARAPLPAAPATDRACGDRHPAASRASPRRRWGRAP